jgi:SAM-dependent methyltransferase
MARRLHRSTRAATFVPAGASPRWPFVIGRTPAGRPPPRHARLLLAWGLIEALLGLQPTRQRAYWRSWSRQELATLMHTGGAGVEHPSRHFVVSLILAGESVLDVGCGAGVGYEVLNTKGLAAGYLGLDSSEPTIEVARELYPSGRFCVGEAEALERQLGTKSFDVVLVRHVLEHLPGFERAMFEAITVSRRLAVFVFALTPRTLPLGVRKLNPRLSPPFYTYIYSRPAIDRYVDGLGLQRRWHDGLGSSRAAWLVGEVNAVLIVSRSAL